MKAIFGLAFVFVVGAVLAGCGGTTAPQTPLREAPSESQMGRAAPIVEASNDFGLKLLEEVAMKGDEPNVLISPISLQLCSAMLLESAKGPERDEMKAALGLKNVTDAQLGELCQILTDALLSDPERPLHVANAVWLNRDPPIRIGKAFADKIARRYDGRIESAKGPAEAHPAINAWVKEKTEGMIPELLETLGPLQWVILLNAVAFQAHWKHEFDPGKTKPMAFHTSGERSVQASMMKDLVEVEALEDDGFTGIQMHYRGALFSMVAMLPKVGSSPLELAKKVRQRGFSTMLRTFRGCEVPLSFPKFKWNGDYKLNESFESLGVRAVFQKIDMSPISQGLEGMRLGRVLQRTFIEVDEEGTRAAAATAELAEGAASPRSEKVVFDRPFLYAIVHNDTSAILFLGICGDPTAER